MMYRRTDGNALFVVHLLDHLLQQGALVEGDASGACATASLRWSRRCLKACAPCC